ncbi:30S ribosomal protein S17 [Candidatus Cerribacteria bacterium 'Amazon FNV 2010 28 9']|uniref:30S ribosomal protein S17 n=1 Tax=Candidatus Cerribacteria bacterium 'Amazon FNV 2010 28 9' TaxID=2081795 RepID=A0A317JN43_9BACT|nr:MAG: 30S ribosomal protein S17 [Candidatus Cerribacteria bacterium 'Amazon FNV 2010 28 9']
MKTFEGTVVRVQPKTAYVEVSSVWVHPIYRKAKKVTQVCACHDNKGVKVGDVVTIAGCRPMSARKRFMIVEK